MADAPWRCSQCGTVNEPVANACRTCGRWPSLFDLEQSAVGQETAVVEDVYRHDAPAPAEVDLPPEPIEVDTDYPDVPEEPAPDTPRPWPQRVGSFIVPILILLYVLISIVTNR